MAERIIFHIDVNNAFLSWTAVYLLKHGYKQDIRKIPAIIGGDEETRHGIVLAKSPIAKKYGIVTAEPIFQARKKCPNLKVFKPNNYEYYQEKSSELMNYLKNYSPDLEQFSIDECFLDMTGTKYLYNNYIDLAYKIKDEIKTKFGYTVNIGIANSKLCAKMASDFEKPDKVHTLFKDEIETKLWPLPVDDLFMCGKRTSEELHKLHINTIKDLSEANDKLLEKHFQTQGRYLKQSALGIDASPVITTREIRQSISTTKTLSHDETDENKLEEILFRQVEDVTRELREKKLFTKTISVIYKDNKFRKYSYQETFANPTNITKEILTKIKEMFKKSYKGEPIRLIGVRLSNLSKEKNTQISLFDKMVNEEQNIQLTIDEINKKFGESVIMPASIKTFIDKNKEK